ncbi:MAG: leucyl/phenylalanyl-tRNA--protein transferase [Flavobacteriales bacterium]
MHVFLITQDLVFPDPMHADEQGLLAVGGDLSMDRLLLAYESGIFPWYNDDQPLLWWSPDPRCVLQPSEVKVSKSMRNVLNRADFEVTADQAFPEVIRACMDTRKCEGTWLNEDMVSAYINLHRLGIAHSIEVWRGDALVGGLYGLSLGNLFFGESMFSKANNMSKVAFICLARGLERWGMPLIDCQVENDHLISLGAQAMPRAEFLEHLRRGMEAPTRRGSWSDATVFHP